MPKEKKRPFFEIKDQKEGDTTRRPGARLVLHQPGRHDEVRRAIIEAVGEAPDDWPKTLTLGWFVWLEHPPTWSFAPRPHAWAAAALEAASVRDRIMDDLADRTRAVVQASRDS